VIVGLVVEATKDVIKWTKYKNCPVPVAAPVHPFFSDLFLRAATRPRWPLGSPQPSLTGTSWKRAGSLRPRRL